MFCWGETFSVLVHNWTKCMITLHLHTWIHVEEHVCIMERHDMARGNLPSALRVNCADCEPTPSPNMFDACTRYVYRCVLYPLWIHMCNVLWTEPLLRTCDKLWPWPYYASRCERERTRETHLLHRLIRKARSGMKRETEVWECSRREYLFCANNKHQEDTRNRRRCSSLQLFFMNERVH